jgi:hypothetical protein
MRHSQNWRALLAAALAIALVATWLAAPAACPTTRGRTPAAQLSGAAATDADDQGLDLLFHPPGLALAVGVFIVNPDPASSNAQGTITYPGGGSNNGGNGGNGGTGGNGSSGGSGSSPGGGNPHGAPEPATLVSGILGASLLSLFGWRRRRQVCGPKA